MEAGHPLAELLERLCEGDADAAAQMFVAYEPMLRMVVRRMLPARLRSRFDSSDIVQSIWGDLLRGFRDAGWRFASPDHLKAFLIKATRNRYLARQRKHLPQVSLGQPLDSAELPLQAKSADPLQQAGLEEWWEKIKSWCPEAHQAIIDLKRQGCTFPEIAARTGYHPSSVRRIFYDLIRRTSQEKSFTNDFLS